MARYSARDEVLPVMPSVSPVVPRSPTMIVVDARCSLIRIPRGRSLPRRIWRSEPVVSARDPAGKCRRPDVYCRRPYFRRPRTPLTEPPGPRETTIPMDLSRIREDEAARLRALDRYCLVDTPREQDFDEIAEAAAELCGTPIAVVNLVGDGRQFFKAEVGLGIRQTPIETSFCRQAILQQDFLHVPDATRDPRFQGNPLVTGEPGLRFLCRGAAEDRRRSSNRHRLRPRHQAPSAQRPAARGPAPARPPDDGADGAAPLPARAGRAAPAARAHPRQRHRLCHRGDGSRGRVTRWNAGAERILGWSEAEMLGWHDRGDLHPRGSRRRAADA